MLKKKSLGQHFLTSTHYVRLITKAARIETGDRVLEIGPGEGVLTRELLSRGAVVTAVEKDRRLIPVLQETFAEEIAAHALFLLEADALEFAPEEHFAEGTYKLVANIPYYITGAILEKFLSARHQPAALALLVQKEVAERIAREPKESILSLSVKAYGEPRYVTTVPAGAFSPPPAVDSAILAIENVSRKNFPNEEHEKRFFELVRAGFAHKRKLLAGNLRPIFGETCLDALKSAGIPETARAEDVELRYWLRLAEREG